MRLSKMVFGALAALLQATGCGTTCETRADEANALVESFQACTTDTICILVDMGDLFGESCVSSFQCPESFPEDADLDAFVEQASPINELKCPQCSEAKCSGVENFVAACNEATGLCEAQPL